MESDWLKNFNPDTFALKGQSPGLTIETMRLVHMMSAYKHGDDHGIVTKAVKTLVKLASTTSQDEFSENQIFFLAPK